MIGRTISHYKILSKLGEGGMGVVYKAEDTTLKRTVALKFLPPALTQDSEARERFVLEAQAASALDHANICSVHEIGEHDGQTFIVMGHYTGETLKKRIERGPLPVDEAVDIAGQIAQGLAKAHAAGIVHRDIKPANIIVTDDGVAKILDFGLVKVSGRTLLTRSGTTLGTAAYMSPEQVRGEHVDGRTDIWSFGVMLYEMLTGKKPFESDYEQALIYSILNDHPKPVEFLRKGIPTALAQIVTRALERNVDERYARIDDLLADLRIVKAAGKGQATTIASILGKRKSKRKLLRRSVIAASAVAIVGVASLVLRLLVSEDTYASHPKPIAVFSFENQTGDKSLDHLQNTIPNLLITNLEQSRYLHVTSWERMRDLLKQLGEKDATFIGRELGTQVCLKEGVDAMVVGSFTRAGDLFLTEMKVIDINTQQVLKVARAKGRGPESLLDTQIDELSMAIARGVGLPDRIVTAAHARVQDVTTWSLEAYNYFLRGRSDLEKGYYEDARKFLTKAVDIDSTFAMAFVALSDAYAGLNNVSASQAALEKGMKRRHRATMKERLFIEARYGYVLKRDEVGYVESLRKLTKDYPNEKRFRMMLTAVDTLGTGARKKEYLAVLDLDPEYTPAMASLSFLFEHEGDSAKALEYLRRYASISPGDARPIAMQGDLLFRLGRLDAAIGKYQEALAAKSDYGSELSVAYVYALKEQYADAIAWVDRFITSALSKSKKVDGYYSRAFYESWRGRSRKAIGDVERGQAIAGESGGEYMVNFGDWIIAEIHRDCADYDRSRAFYKRYYEYAIDYARRNFPRFDNYVAAYHSYLCKTDLDQGRVDSARAHWAMAKLHPRGYDSLLYANVLFAEDSTEKALALLQSKGASGSGLGGAIALTISHSSPNVRELAAQIHQKRKDFPRAIQEYERLATFNPKSGNRMLTHPRVHLRLAELYHDVGRDREAIERYRHFLRLWEKADGNRPEVVRAREMITVLSKQKAAQ